MEITKKVDMLVRDVIEENGYRLDEVLYEKEGSMMFLRLIIDKEGFVDVDIYSDVRKRIIVLLIC